MIKKKFKKKNQKKGVLFWIEGYSGVGKTSISRVAAKIIRKNISNLVLIQGNEMRSMLKLKGFSKQERTNASKHSGRLIKFLTNNGINVMYTVLCLSNKTRKIYKSSVSNFLHIYIKGNVKQIIKKNLKPQIYNLKKNIVGIDIKPEFPKDSNIIITNNFKKNIDQLGKDLAKDIKNCCKNRF